MESACAACNTRQSGLNETDELDGLLMKDYFGLGFKRTSHAPSCFHMTVLS
jgi:hypothetical protein